MECLSLCWHAPLRRDHPGYCTAEVGNPGGTYELPCISMSHIRYASKIYKEMAGTQYERYLWFWLSTVVVIICIQNLMKSIIQNELRLLLCLFYEMGPGSYAEGWYRIICKISVAKSQGKRKLGRRRCRSEDSIMINLNKNILTLRSAEK
jgi:hypothetical protein